MADKKKNVIHMNKATEEGYVYCKRMGKVVKLQHIDHVCEMCPFFFGTAQGEGVECRWEDDREEVDVIEYVDNPFKEEEDIAIHEFKKMQEEDKKSTKKKDTKDKKKK